MIPDPVGSRFAIPQMACAAAVMLWMMAFPAARAAAQVTTGTVYGTITDVQGGVMPGVTLVLTS